MTDNVKIPESFQRIGDKNDCIACVCKGDQFGLPACGWGNGYVVLPKSHPLFGQNCCTVSVLQFDTAIRIDWYQNRLPGFDPFDGYWVIGFHTTVLGDNKQDWPKNRVVSETKKLLAAFATYDGYNSN